MVKSPNSLIRALQVLCTLLLLTATGQSQEVLADTIYQEGLIHLKKDDPEAFLKARIYAALAQSEQFYEREKIWHEHTREGAQLLMKVGVKEDTLWALIYLLSISKSIEEGELYFQECMQLAEEFGDSIIQVQILSELSNIYGNNGALELQEAFLNKALAYGAVVLPALRIHNLSLKAKINVARGKYRAGIELAKQVIEEAPVQHFSGLQRAHLSLSEAYYQIGRPALAYEALLKANIMRDSLEQELGEKALLGSIFSQQRGLQKKVLLLESVRKEGLLKQQIGKQRLWLVIMALCLLLLVGLVYYVYRNLQQRRRAEQCLLEQQRLLELNNARLQSFSGVVSHDILSNLELIIAFGNVLVEPSFSKDKLLNYYNSSKEVMHTLKTYCIDLLIASRSEKNDAFTSVEAGNAILEDIKQHYSVLLKTLDFDLQLEPLPGIPLPPTVLQQFLHNGITNALKYVPQEGIRPVLTIGGGIGKQGLPRWFIQDNGPGLGALKNALPTEGTGGSKGQGIGLHKLKEQLALYGGSLSMNNNTGGGLRLVVTGGSR